MNLRCPNCGGQVVYDPKTAKLICKYCQGETEANNFSIPQESAKPESEEYMETNIYHCSSCGADLMLNGTEASTFCSYCGSPTIVFDRVSKELRPKWIIPFKITESQALKCIRERFEEGSYIPKKIKELTVDKVHAIYMPYWLFTTYIRRGMMVEASTNDDGTFLYVRDASCRYKKMTLDASMKLNNEMSRRLEPFHMDELVEFDVAYLSGFYADKYDVHKEALASANLERCRDYLDDAILDTCPHVNKMTTGSLCNYKKKDIREESQIENVEYALLPAYFVNLKYDTGRQLVIVNGQTGKVVGNLPFEKERFISKFIIHSIIASPIFMILSYIAFWNPSLWMIFVILAAITGFMIAGGISSYKNYQQGKYRMSGTTMTSYVNNREDII